MIPNETRGTILPGVKLEKEYSLSKTITQQPLRAEDAG